MLKGFHVGDISNNLELKTNRTLISYEDCNGHHNTELKLKYTLSMIFYYEAVDNPHQVRSWSKYWNARGRQKLLRAS
jgi:Mor family transcriptional regulator